MAEFPADAVGGILGRRWTRRAALAGAVPAAAVALTAAHPTEFAGLASHPSVVTDTTGALEVKQYGAKGNGTSDDGPAIQRALDAAHSSGVGTVVIPPGTYKVGQTLNAFAPIRIVGVGGWSSTTLVFDDGLTTGLSIRQPTTAVVYPGPAMQLIDFGLEYGGTGTMVECNESSLSSPFQDTLVSGCRFYLKAAGTAFLTVNQRDIIITSCQFLGTSSTGVGIALSDSDNTKIENNVFYNLEYGVYGQRASVRTFDAGCLFTGNSMYGFVDALHFEGWELVQVIGNILDGATGSCLNLLDCYHSLISDNYLGVNGTTEGLLIQTSNPYGVGFLGQITFRGNYINHYEGASGAAAIGVYGVSAQRPEDQVIIEDNIINSYPSVGVHLRNAQNVIVKGNMFTAAATGSTSVLDETPGSNYILDNLIDGSIDAAGDVQRDNYQRVAYPT